MNQDIKNNWEDFLNPKLLKNNLIIASLYITAFEILKETIIDRIKYFFTNGINKNNSEFNDDYDKEVLSKNKSSLYASLFWLKEINAINDDDLNKFEEIKNCRNELAHKMLNLLTSEMKYDPNKYFNILIELLTKIEKWWIINFELTLNSDFDNKEIDEENITPGVTLLINLMLDISLGDDDLSNFYYNKFKHK